MEPIASLRSLWTFPPIRRMGSPGGCGYYPMPLILPVTVDAAYGLHQAARRRCYYYPWHWYPPGYLWA